MLVEGFLKAFASAALARERKERRAKSALVGSMVLYERLVKVISEGDYCTVMSVEDGSPDEMQLVPGGLR